MIFQKVKQVCQKNVIFVAICHWYFKNIGFKHEPYLCNGCHDLVQKAMSFDKGSAYRIHFWYMRKDDDAINIINGSNLTDKRGVL